MGRLWHPMFYMPAHVGLNMLSNTRCAGTPTTLCDKVLSNLDLSSPINTWLSHLAVAKSVTEVAMGTK